MNKQQPFSSKPSFDSVQNEISAIDNLIAQVQEKIKHLKTLEGDLARVLSESDMNVVQAKMEKTTAEANVITLEVNQRLKRLQQQVAQMPPNADQAMGKNLLSAQSRKFLNTLTAYQQVQRQNRDACRDRFARQYRIVNPGATDEEVTQKLQEGASGGVFSSQAMDSSRAKLALEGAQQRAQDIQRIAQHIEQINQLFADVAAMVNQQGQLIDKIEFNTYQAQGNMEKADVHLASAVNGAAAARRKRWIVFAIITVVILILIIVLAVTAVHNKWFTN